MENEAMSEAKKTEAEMAAGEKYEAASPTPTSEAFEQVSPPPTSVAELLSKSADQVTAKPPEVDDFVMTEMAKAQAAGKWLFMVARVENGKIFADWKTNNFPGEDILPAINLLKDRLSGQIAGPTVVDLPKAEPPKLARAEDYTIPD